jgi:hypothetical protein
MDEGHVGADGSRGINRVAMGSHGPVGRLSRSLPSQIACLQPTPAMSSLANWDGRLSTRPQDDAPATPGTSTPHNHHQYQHQHAHTPATQIPIGISEHANAVRTASCFILFLGIRSNPAMTSRTNRPI